MAIYRLMQNAAFEPEHVKAMASAYEGVLVDLGLKDRNDLLTELIAKKIFEYAQTGQRDPIALRKHVLEEIKSR